MSVWKATGFLLMLRLPFDRAVISRMLNLYVPWPLMPSYVPVQCPSAQVPCSLSVSRQQDLLASAGGGLLFQGRQ
jgi:hypothetical protein